ncbi:MAG: PAS domain S-box protein [Brevinematia bacterium]
MNFEEVKENFEKLINTIEKIHGPIVNKRKDFASIKEKLLNICEEGTSIANRLKSMLDEKNQITKVLEEKTKTLETLISKLNVAIFIFDVDENENFIFQELNPTHEELTGFKTEEIKGKKPKDFLPPEIANEIEKNYTKCVESKRVIEYEEKLFLKGKKPGGLQG